MGCGGCAGTLDPETITCVVAVALPAEFMAVSVYTVFVCGVTALVPLTATLPMPLSMLTLVAPFMLQLRVELSPGCIVGGLALNELITGTCAAGVAAGGVWVEGFVGLAGRYMQLQAVTRIKSAAIRIRFIYITSH